MGKTLNERLRDLRESKKNHKALPFTPTVLPRISRVEPKSAGIDYNRLADIIVTKQEDRKRQQDEDNTKLQVSRKAERSERAYALFMRRHGSMSVDQKTEIDKLLDKSNYLVEIANYERSLKAQAGKPAKGEGEVDIDLQPPIDRQPIPKPVNPGNATPKPPPGTKEQLISDLDKYNAKSADYDGKKFAQARRESFNFIFPPKAPK